MRIEILISVEDINLWLRISRHYQFGFINEILGMKGFHGNSLTDNFEQMYTADIYNFRKLAVSFPELAVERKSILFYRVGELLLWIRRRIFFYEIIWQSKRVSA